ncbi:MAG: hypothetical protein SVX43_17210 [Cyanobacteriota bacterium]|nr:hypothetical protein [Cyanobacteriota bacterium]
MPLSWLIDSLLGCELVKRYRFEVWRVRETLEGDRERQNSRRLQRSRGQGTWERIGSVGKVRERSSLCARSP